MDSSTWCVVSFVDFSRQYQSNLSGHTSKELFPSQEERFPPQIALTIYQNLWFMSPRFLFVILRFHWRCRSDCPHGLMKMEYLNQPEINRLLSRPPAVAAVVQLKERPVRHYFTNILKNMRSNVKYRFISSWKTTHFKDHLDFACFFMLKN